MAKTKLVLPRRSTKDIRAKFTFFYTEKFFNKWMSKYDFIGLNYQQKHYIMKKFWSVGSICCSQITSANEELAGLVADKVIDFKENQLIFTPWTFANRYNIYDFPTHVNLVNTRGVKFITPRVLKIDEEAIIIYAQKNHKSVYSSIEAKLKELIDIEMKMRVARKAQAQPWLFAFSPEDYDQVKRLQEQLDEDEPYLYVHLQDIQSAKGLTSGAPYVLDKLEQDRQKVENDILTMLGVNNVGIGEKKEHLVVDEINANNEDIEQQSYSFQSEIEDGFDRVNKIFSHKVMVIDMNEIINDENEEEEDKEDKEDVSMEDN